MEAIQEGLDQIPLSILIEQGVIPLGYIPKQLHDPIALQVTALHPGGQFSLVLGNE